jgi:uncharacterized protein (DUF983 family)
MEQCHVCGSHRKVCSACGAELHKRFDDFIVRSEIIYAIFMAWGYAASAEAVIRAKDWATLPLLVISTFVLIRFFFAPTRNLYSAALLAEKHKKWHWVVFVLDFPLLLFHSFAYYSMCLAIAGSEQNAYRFFEWFVCLLSANVIWLSTIAFRMRLFKKRAHYWTFIKWCVNNFVSIALFFVVFLAFSGTPVAFFDLFFSKDIPMVIGASSAAFWVFFGIALLNCVADVVLTASDYLGFEN